MFIAVFNRCALFLGIGSRVSMPGYPSSRFSFFVILLLATCAGCAGPDPSWVKVEISDGLVLVPSRGGEETGCFLLDTGSGTGVLNRRTYGNYFAPGGGNQATIPFSMIPIKPFDQSDLHEARLLDLDSFSKVTKRKIIVIIGLPSFSQRIIQIDYANSSLRLLSRKDFDAKKHGEEWKLVRLKSHVYTSPSVNGEQINNVLVDTGYDGFLLVDEDQKKHVGYEPFATTQALRLQIDVGTQDGWSFFPPSIRVGQSVFNNVRIDCYGHEDKSRVDLIGGAFLHNYVVTFDLEKSSLYLERTKRG